MRTVRLLSLLILLGLGLLFLDSGALFAQTTPPGPPPEPVDTTLDALLAKAGGKGGVRVIVGLRLGKGFKPEGALSGADAADQRAAIDQAQTDLVEHLASGNVDVIARYKSAPFLALRLDQAALQRLIDSGRVSTIQEDAPVPPDLTNAMPIVGANQMWALGDDGTGWVVAILDTGIDEDHPFLKGRIVKTDQACYSNAGGFGEGTSLCPNHNSFQFGSNSANALTAACKNGSSLLCTHGTHVAGIAAGKAVKGSPGSGVAPAAKILPIQIFTRFDSPAFCQSIANTPCVLTYPSDQLSALDYLYFHHTQYNIASANMSLGGGRYTAACDADARKLLVDNLWSVGIPTVVSAGNDYFRDAVGTPGCISTAVTVGATDGGDGLASFSNRGPLLDLLAPGVSIRSSIPNNTWATFSGTSMAAPIVTGAFADLREAKPNATVAQLLTALQNHGLSISYASAGTTVSTTRINLAGAYDSLTGADSPPNQPYDPSPGGGAAGIATSVTLTWLGGDPDGGPVTYDVMLSTSPTPAVVVCNDIPTASCPSGPLLANTTYFWKVAASAGGKTTTGPVWSFTTAGASTVINDDFDAALGIGGLPYNDSWNTANATTAPDDPPEFCANGQGSLSVWYRYTPSAYGTLRLKTVGSGYDTVIAVWTGSRGMLREWACDDDGGGAMGPSSLDMPVEPGVTYHIEVIRFGSGSAGSLTLDVSAVSPPGNTAPYTPSEPTPSSAKTGVSANPKLSWNGGDPELGDQVTYDVYMSATNNPPNIPGDLVCHVVGVSTCTPSSIPLSHNTTYRWRVVATDDSSPTPASTTGPVWSFTTSMTPPPNDDVSGAIDISASMPYTDLNRDITGAMTAEDDPFFACVPGQRWQTVWYAFTPNHNGLLSLDTIGSKDVLNAALDTALAVWSGSPGSLVSVGCNDDENFQAHIYTSKIANLPVVNGTAYKIEAASVYNDGATLTLHASFTPTNTPPIKPNAPSPANGATGVTTAVLMTPYGFQWTSGDVDPDSNPVHYVVKLGATNPPQTVICNTTAMSCTLPSGTLAYGKKYYWQVIATDSFSTPAVTPGPVWSFTTEATPPELRTPKDEAGVTTRLPKFTWKAVKGASLYELQVITAADFEDGEPYTPTITVSQKPTKYTVKATNPALDYGRYYWRVRAFAGGVWTEFSTPFSFDVALNKTPRKDSAVGSHLPKFTWQAVKTATHYNLQVFLNDATCAGSPVLQKLDLSKTTYQMKSPDAPLEFGTYFWRVQVSQPAPTTYGPCWPFDVSSLKAPRDASTTAILKPRFTWGANKNAADYHITAELVPDNGDPNTLKIDRVVTAPKYTATPADALSFGRYVWRVQEGSGGFSLPTPDFSLYITNMRKPANKKFIADNTPTFSWKKVAGATYTLEIASDAAFSSIVRSYSAGNKLAYTVPLLGGLARGKYHWRVIAVVSSGPVTYTMPGWSITIGP